MLVPVVRLLPGKKLVDVSLSPSVFFPGFSVLYIDESVLSYIYSLLSGFTLSSESQGAV